MDVHLDPNQSENFKYLYETFDYTLPRIRWQQDKNDKEAREDTEGKSGRMHRGR